MVAAGERSAPRGTLTVTAPVAAGEDLLRPILDAFMDEYPAVSVRLHLLDRPANLIDEGIDVALRLAHLADSTLVAICVGEVRRVVVAAPRYLAQHPRIVEPGDLTRHQIIAMTHFGLDSWTFPPIAGSAVPRSMPLTPRFIVNSIVHDRDCHAPAVVGSFRLSRGGHAFDAVQSKAGLAIHGLRAAKQQFALVLFLFHGAMGQSRIL